MNQFSIKCNQCESEEVFFHVAHGAKKLTIYCAHCPMFMEVKLQDHRTSEVVQMPLFDLKEVKV